MTSFLKKPVRHHESTAEKWIIVLVFGLFIFLFLFLFKPFGLSDIEPRIQLFLTLGFGFVTSFVLFVFKFLIEPFVLKAGLTFGKNILWDLLIASSIGVANYFYLSLVNRQMLAFRYLLMAVWAAILVGVIPVTISYFMAFNRMYRKALRKADVDPEDVLPEDEIILRAGNPRNQLKVNPRKIICLCSNDNYITVILSSGGSLQKSTIRGTLQSAEKELSRYNRFFRCHKCYIINLDHVERIRGNRQNMTVRLAGYGNEIPVSRSRSERILQIAKRV